jgi:CDP-diacylglycerol---glycerol-3-phosphate 3-phosphatidyltransferase
MTAAARPEWRTWANLVTAVRGVAGLVLFAVAAVQRDVTFNYVGLGVYWALDVLDGFLARRLGQETRLGAQLDILCDRLLVSCFYVNTLYLDDRPGMVVPVALFLIQFMVLDQWLSNQFLRWPILSPNYFFQADRGIWLLNWSALAKAANTGLVTLLIVLVPSPWPATAVCLALIALKTHSCVKLLRLPAPELAWVTAEPRSHP